MTKLVRSPDSEEFSKLVKLYEKTSKNLDSTYLKDIRAFGNRELGNLADYDVESILRPYLLKWGKMGRVLGLKGCRRICYKLADMDPMLGMLRQKKLAITSLEKLSGQIEAIYDEIMNTDWKSEMGRHKRVGPTAASKVLHLVAPNLFMIWDREIRDYYGFKEDGDEYVRFLSNMKNWLKKLKSTIERLGATYHKSLTKVIDEYNWMKCRT